MKKLYKKIAAVAAVLIVALAVVWLARGQQAAKVEYTAHTRDLFAMDTYFALKAYGPAGEKALDLCEEKVRELEGVFSVTRDDSDVSLINAGEKHLVGEDTFRLIQEALALGRETNGALDITMYPVVRAWGFTTDSCRVPEEQELCELLEQVDYEKVATDVAGYTVLVPKGAELDLGAVAKGYTGDCLLDILRGQGVTSAMVDLGGNVQVLGSKPDGSAWKVAVRDPFDKEKELGVLEVTDKAVITSGSYERFFEENGKRYWHILDPEHGYPADNGLVSVTVVGDKGVRCDGLSTALFVMGKEEAIAFWKQSGDFEMILVTKEGELLVTEGLEAHFKCNEAWQPLTISK